MKCWDNFLVGTGTCLMLTSRAYMKWSTPKIFRLQLHSATPPQPTSEINTNIHVLTSGGTSVAWRANGGWNLQLTFRHSWLRKPPKFPFSPEAGVWTDRSLISSGALSWWRCFATGKSDILTLVKTENPSDHYIPFLLPQKHPFQQMDMVPTLREVELTVSNLEH